MKLRRYLPTGNVGHLQVASVPDRNEPDRGEIDFEYLFDIVDELEFAGWIGCEYRPRSGALPSGTSAGLGWIKNIAEPARANARRAQLALKRRSRPAYSRLLASAIAHLRRPARHL